MEEYRLQKFLAHAGIASRRSSEEIIASGVVAVNGKTVTDPAVKVTRADKVTVKGEAVTITRTHTYIIMNKPTGVLSSVKDDRGRKCVVDLIETDARLYPIGRLDYDTSGLIILTDDGDLMQYLTHPSHEIWKTYEATIKGEIKEEELAKLRIGVDLGEEFGKTLPASADVVKFNGKNAVVGIKIREGKNRQVRRMLEAVGHPVLKLRRTALGGLMLGDLKPGEYRKMKRKDFEDLLGRQAARKLGYYT